MAREWTTLADVLARLRTQWDRGDHLGGWAAGMPFAPIVVARGSGRPALSAGPRLTCLRVSVDPGRCHMTSGTNGSSAPGAIYPCTARQPRIRKVQKETAIRGWSAFRPPHQVHPTERKSVMSDTNAKVEAPEVLEAQDADITIEELDEVAGGAVSSFSTAACPGSTLSSLQA